MSNPVIENAKTVSPVEASGNSNNGHSNIIKKLLIDAGISGLSENSGADEILATSKQKGHQPHRHIDCRKSRLFPGSHRDTLPDPRKDMRRGLVGLSQ